MAIALLGSTFHSGSTSTTSLTCSHTVAAGSNRMIQVWVFNNTDNTTSTGVTYPGTTLSLYQAFNVAASSRIELWRGVAPTEGTGDAVISFGAAISCAAIVESWSGVDQTTPSSTGATASASGAISCTATTVAGDVVSDACVLLSGSATITGPDAGQTQNQNGNTASTRDIGSSYKAATTTSTTMGWTQSHTVVFGMLAVPIKQASTATTIDLTANTLTLDNGGLLGVVGDVTGISHARRTRIRRYR